MGHLEITCFRWKSHINAYVAAVTKEELMSRPVVAGGIFTHVDSF